MQMEEISLEEVLLAAWCDQTVRGRYFLTPLALELRKKSSEGAHPRYDSHDSESVVRGKGNLEGCAPITPDGQKVCFDFNSISLEC